MLLFLPRKNAHIHGAYASRDPGALPRGLPRHPLPQPTGQHVWFILFPTYLSRRSFPLETLCQVPDLAYCHGLPVKLPTAPSEPHAGPRHLPASAHASGGSTPSPRSGLQTELTFRVVWEELKKKTKKKTGISDSDPGNLYTLKAAQVI